jgi:hypothetical protein
VITKITNPPCRLGIKEKRHCVERQVNRYRRTCTGNLNILFVSCRGCKHWLTDEEYAEAQKGLQRFKRTWEARIG